MIKKKAGKQAVIVTTSYRGVFFGYTDDSTGDRISLTDARMILYWSADIGGFMGLAAVGPTPACKISKSCSIEVRSITSVCAVSPDALSRWKSWD